MKKAIIFQLFFAFVVGMTFAQNWASYTPTTMTFSSYQPSTSSASDYIQALQRQQERHDQAVNQLFELDTLIGGMRNLLHNDPETITWYNENIKVLRDDVKNEINNGDYGQAYKLALDYVVLIKYDSELNARIRTNKEYKDAVSAIQNRSDLTWVEKNEWMKTYQYKFVPFYDENGDVIGGYSWMEIGGPNNTPVIVPAHKY